MFIRIHFKKRDSLKHELGYSRDRNLNDKNNTNKTSTLITMISSHASTAGRAGQPASRLLQLALSWPGTTEQDLDAILDLHYKNRFEHSSSSINLQSLFSLATGV